MLKAILAHHLPLLFMNAVLVLAVVECFSLLSMSFVVVLVVSFRVHSLC